MSWSLENTLLFNENHRFNYLLSAWWEFSNWTEMWFPGSMMIFISVKTFCPLHTEQHKILDHKIKVSLYYLVDHIEYKVTCSDILSVVYYHLEKCCECSIFLIYSTILCGHYWLFREDDCQWWTKIRLSHHILMFLVQ